MTTPNTDDCRTEIARRSAIAGRRVQKIALRAAPRSRRFATISNRNTRDLQNAVKDLALRRNFPPAGISGAHPRASDAWRDECAGAVGARR